MKSTTIIEKTSISKEQIHEPEVRQTMIHESYESKIIKDGDIRVMRYYESFFSKSPISHPKNCSSECPYGHDRAFCFPCYKKLMAERKSNN